MTDQSEIDDAELLALDMVEDYLRAEESLAHFIKGAWHVLEPGKVYLDNWHIGFIAEHLEAVDLGQILRLLINEPPRHMKSIECTVSFPAWCWIRNAAKRFISASFSASLSIKHNVDRRNLIESAWYQMAWGDRFKMAPDQNQKSEFMNDKRGHMIATSVGTSATGKGGDILIWDDPLDPQQAASDLERGTANDWVATYPTRLDNKKTGAIVGVMQRLHEKDPTGHVLAEGGWTHLVLPAEAPKKIIIIFPRSKKKIVREEGSLLWPEREGPAEIALMKKALGSSKYQGQYAQDPQPAKGGFFKRIWWKRFRELPNGIRSAQFWDCAQVPGVSNDWSVCATWLEAHAGYYRKNLWREKVDYTEIKRTAKDLYYAHKPDAVVIEFKGHGIALYQDLQNETTIPVIKWPAEDSKMVRASRAQPAVEAGKCFLPEDDEKNEAFINEHEKFPNSENDDQVDTTSMMVDYFRQAETVPRIREL